MEALPSSSGGAFIHRKAFAVPAGRLLKSVASKTSRLQSLPVLHSSQTNEAPHPDRFYFGVCRLRSPFAQTQTANSPSGTPDRSAPIRSMLDTYCIGCHSTAGQAGGIAFAGMSLDAIGDNAEIWEKAVRKCVAT